MRSEIRRMKLERARYCQSELGTSNVSRTTFGRYDPPRSSRQWICRRKPSTSNVRRALCRVKETNRAKISLAQRRPNKIAIVLNSNQDPIAHAQPKQKRTQEIKKGSENQRCERLQQIRSSDGRCQGHIPACNFNH